MGFNVWLISRMYEKNAPMCVLDGGLATELEESGISLLNDPLWSARVICSSPRSIVEVHKSYLHSGADIITTSSYQASIPGFVKYLGVSIEDSKKLIESSVELAKLAKDEYIKSTNSKQNILIAGSVGPYGAALADGSEYTGDYCDKLSVEELMEWHRPRVECLLNAGVDTLAFETIPAMKEAEALLKLLLQFPNAKAWISFCCQSMHENCRGESISSAAEMCLKLVLPSQLMAIGVNCCPPEYAGTLLKDISAVCNDTPLIVYPNSGEKWNSQTGWYGTKTMSSHLFLEDWVKASAKIIGGCCRTSPEDTSKIHEFLKKYKC